MRVVRIESTGEVFELRDVAEWLEEGLNTLFVEVVHELLRARIVLGSREHLHRNGRLMREDDDLGEGDDGEIGYLGST